MGAFRFFDKNTKLISLDAKDPLTVKDVRAFQHCIEQLQSGEKIHDSDFFNIVLFGSSLGGARPKLSVIDADNTLWLAKFSSIHDTYDNPAREAISLYLAKKCLLNVPSFKIIPIDKGRSVLLVKRFDRNDNERIYFLSAKTFLHAKDGESSKFSYLDIASIIESNSLQTTSCDLQEIYKRLIFNVIIGNKDDHLRNHGFLYRENGWQLSPVYDVEIDPDKASHALALDDEGSLSCSLEDILRVSEYYGLSYDIAKDIVLSIAKIVFNWKQAALELNIPGSSVKKMPDYDEYVDEVNRLVRYKKIVDQTHA